jgi:2-amino-4-hydroxy-6-hydroxymethyldihydropteridine diphosphokinase
VDHVRRVVIGLGSNVGDRRANLDAAVAKLREDRSWHILRRSPVYESPPAGGPPQGDYLNAAVLLVSSLEPRAILERVLAIEVALGRVRSPDTRWGPRTIDLDLLWIEGEAVDEETLVVPHPRLPERPFALRPLVDLVPDASDFRTGRTFASLPAAEAPLTKVAEGGR